MHNYARHFLPPFTPVPKIKVPKMKVWRSRIEGPLGRGIEGPGSGGRSQMKGGGV